MYMHIYDTYSGPTLPGVDFNQNLWQPRSMDTQISNFGILSENLVLVVIRLYKTLK
jgi:hypothetical protein